MSSWGAVFRFLVAFGGGCAIFAGVLAGFLWVMSRIDRMNEEYWK